MAIGEIGDKAQERAPGHRKQEDSAQLAPAGSAGKSHTRQDSSLKAEPIREEEALVPVAEKQPGAQRYGRGASMASDDLKEDLGNDQGRAGERVEITPLRTPSK